MIISHTCEFLQLTISFPEASSSISKLHHQIPSNNREIISKLENGSNACIMMLLKTFQTQHSAKESQERPTSKFNFPTDLCSCQATQVMTRIVNFFSLILLISSQLTCQTGEGRAEGKEEEVSTYILRICGSAQL